MDRVDPTSRSRIWKLLTDSYLYLSNELAETPTIGSRTISNLMSKNETRDLLSYEAISRTGICNHEDNGEQSILQGWSAYTKKKRNSLCGFDGDGVLMFHASYSLPFCGSSLS